MDIKYFINNYICPELKSLILLYTLSTPIKEELLELFEKRKYIKYNGLIYIVSGIIHLECILNGFVYL